MKKKLWITSLLAALSLTVVAGGVACTTSPEVVMTQAAENWQVGEIDNTYLYGTSFEVPAAEVEVNGETVVATATVTYPNGVTVNTANVPLNQAGTYTVTYRAVVNGVHCVEEKTFNVENKSYLTQKKDTTVEYGHYSEYNANSNGLLVRMAEGDELTFSKLIDFTSITGSTPLVEFFITPDTSGVYDFNTLVFTFTDALDSSVYLRYRMLRYPAEDRGFNWGYVDVGGNGQSQVGCENGSHRSGWVGTPIEFTFSAAMHEGNQWWGKLVERQPDLRKCGLYFNPVTMEATTNGSHIAHLNNLEYYETAWTGFPSGMAKLTVTVEDVVADTANFCITRVAGIDLTAELFAEEDAPIVNVPMEQDEMPKGEVGLLYKIPQATAVDYYSGACEVKTSVFRDYATDSPVNVSSSNGAFLPTAAGWYTITYTAKDTLGNEGYTLRNVYVAEDLGEIEITLPDNYATEATLGSWVNLDDIVYTGDCGQATVTKTVTLGEESYVVTDGFRPEIAGEWKVTYTVTDYLGRVGSVDYIINGIVGEGYLLLDELVMPWIFVSDSQYTLPVIYATDYSSGKAERKLASVIVTDKNGEKTYAAGETFIPSVEENGDIVTVSYQYDGQVLDERQIPAVLVKNGSKINGQNYFYGQGFTTTFQDDKGTEDPEDDEYYSAGLKIVADKNSALCGWTFATPQLMDNFSLFFEGIAANTMFEALQITLTDTQNASEEICITLNVKGKASSMVVCGTEMITPVNMTSEQYKVSYKEGKFTFGDISLAVKETTSGEAFNGFSSSLAYVRVEMVNAKKGASYKFLSINEANISRRNLEVFAPNFKILGDFGGNQSLNSVYEIFPAIANDAFAPNTSVTMTATAPDGSILVDKDGVKLENVPTDKTYYITLSQYGKYQITYTVEEKDWVAKNTLSLVKAIFVVDEEEPQVKFVSGAQTTAKVGEIITMPKYIFQDNITANENITIVSSVINPYGRVYYFTKGQNAIKCLYAGEYKFIVMVMDEHGNMAYATHTITVTA